MSDDSEVLHKWDCQYLFQHKPTWDVGVWERDVPWDEVDRVSNCQKVDRRYARDRGAHGGTDNGEVVEKGVGRANDVQTTVDRALKRKKKSKKKQQPH